MNIQSGLYRKYIKLPFVDYGIKIACPNFSFKEFGFRNWFCTLLCGIIMNIKEKVRFDYYNSHKTIRQWNNDWVWNKKTYRFCPIYFSCGLFNIVRHAKIYSKDVFEKLDREELLKETGYLVEISCSNFGVCNTIHGYHRVAVDYGDFDINSFNSRRVMYTDYK
jgi:hypothetical protein